MSVSGISLSSAPTQNTTVRGTINQWKQGLTKLSDALQSGDLKSAQTEFQNLVKLHESNESSRQPGSGNTTLQADFKALGNALSSGDLNSAQAAFGQLRTDLQSVRSQQQSSRPTGPAPRPADSDGDHDGTTGAPVSYTATGTQSASGGSIGTILGLYA